MCASLILNHIIKEQRNRGTEKLKNWRTGELENRRTEEQKKLKWKILKSISISVMIIMVNHLLIRFTKRSVFMNEVVLN